MKDRIAFKRLVSVEDAIKILESYYLPPPPIKEVRLENAYGRVLAERIVSPVDIPPFTRSLRDGYAVRYEDIHMALEDRPVKLKLVGSLDAGSVERLRIERGEAVKVATGAPVPGGANTIVMLEYAEEKDGYVYIYKKSSPGGWIQHEGSDVRMGEVVFYPGTVLGERELGVIGGLGIDRVKIYSPRKAAYISTGDELRRPGEPIEYGGIYDTNVYSLRALLNNDGFEVLDLGIARDNIESFYEMISEGLKISDVVFLSGSTSVGGKDILLESLSLFKNVKILFYGIRIKPGKPTLAAEVDGKLVIGLPGFPVSALMIYRRIFSEYFRRVNMLPKISSLRVEAESGYYFRGETGVRHLYPVYLRSGGNRLYFYPVKTVSGALATLANADGFIEIHEDTLYVDRGEKYIVTLFSKYISPSDIVSLSSHSIALDRIFLKFIRRSGYNVKRIVVGSTGALVGIREGYNDFGGLHLLDENGEYNISYIKKYNVKNARLYHGFYRRIGLIVARGNPLGIKSIRDIVDKDVKFINRITGSGIRVYIDLMLSKIAEERGISFDEIKRDIDGYTVEAKTHSGVVGGVESGLYDVGIAAEIATLGRNIDFIPLTWERYDYIVNKERLEEKPIKDLIDYLGNDESIEILKNLNGIRVDDKYMDVLVD